MCYGPSVGDECYGSPVHEAKREVIEELTNRFIKQKKKFREKVGFDLVCYFSTADQSGRLKNMSRERPRFPSDGQ